MEPNKESLIKAIGEFDKLGKDSFLNKYSYGENIKYELLYEGKTYPPKAIWGRAYEFLNALILNKTSQAKLTILFYY